MESVVFEIVIWERSIGNVCKFYEGWPVLPYAPLQCATNNGSQPEGRKQGFGTFPAEVPRAEVLHQNIYAEMKRTE